LALGGLALAGVAARRRRHAGEKTTPPAEVRGRRA
jgi:hypothetical protein